MSYNRWMPVQCSSELYHHGVKGMKWGKHLFGKGVEVQAGAGGGGGSNEEGLKLLEEYASRSAKETAEKTKEYIKEHSIAGAVNKVKKKLNLGGSIKAEHPLLSQDATNKGTRTKLQNRRRR